VADAGMTAGSSGQLSSTGTRHRTRRWGGRPREAALGKVGWARRGASKGHRAGTREGWSLQPAPWGSTLSGAPAGSPGPARAGAHGLAQQRRAASSKEASDTRKGQCRHGGRMRQESTPGGTRHCLPISYCTATRCSSTQPVPGQQRGKGKALPVRLGHRWLQS